MDWQAEDVGDILMTLAGSASPSGRIWAERTVQFDSWSSRWRGDRGVRAMNALEVVIRPSVLGSQYPICLIQVPGTRHTVTAICQCCPYAMGKYGGVALDGVVEG